MVTLCGNGGQHLVFLEPEKKTFDNGAGLEEVQEGR